MAGHWGGSEPDGFVWVEEPGTRKPTNREIATTILWNVFGWSQGTAQVRLTEEIVRALYDREQDVARALAPKGPSMLELRGAIALLLSARDGIRPSDRFYSAPAPNCEARAILSAALQTLYTQLDQMLYPVSKCSCCGQKLP